MAALRTSGVARTHTVRLLVGTDEEHGAEDMEAYKKQHALPDLSLVLDSDFPVVVGEKAWAEWVILAQERTAQATGPVEVVDLTAGQAVSIVPDVATLTLRWRKGTPDWETLAASGPGDEAAGGHHPGDPGHGPRAHRGRPGRAAHAGTSLSRGRNALVALAVAMHGRLPPCAASDLLEYVHAAGRDAAGRGLGLPRPDPLWGAVDTNFGVLKREGEGWYGLRVNLRSPPLAVG
jgi:succinyl-diaminopimelate desuccinylase